MNNKIPNNYESFKFQPDLKKGSDDLAKPEKDQPVFKNEPAPLKPLNVQPDIKSEPEITKPEKVQPVLKKETDDKIGFKTGFFSAFLNKLRFAKSVKKAESPSDKKTQPHVSFFEKHNITPQFLKSFINKLHLDKLRKKEKSPTAKNAESGTSRIKTILDKYNLPPQFILSGLLVIASITIYFLIVSPLESKNLNLKNELNNKASKLEQYSINGRKIHNDKWVKFKEQEIEIIKNELQICNQILADRDKVIEKNFTDINGNEITDSSLWKKSYIKETSEQMNLLKYNGIEANMTELSFKVFGQQLPLQDEINTEQKRFWIQAELINLLIKNRRFVKSFLGLSFRDTIDSALPILEELYTPIPFILKIKIELPDLLYFIREMLNSGLNFYIENIDINSMERIDPNPIKNSNIFNNVIIYAYAIDFKTPEKAE